MAYPDDKFGVKAIYVTGVSVDSTSASAAATNYTAIQAALTSARTTGGGTVVVDYPGHTITVQCTATQWLAIGSDTELRVTRGTTLRPSSGNTLIRNYNWNSTVYPVTGAPTMTALSSHNTYTMTFTCTGHPFVAGAYALIKNETTGQWNGVYRVESVTTNTFSVVVAYTTGFQAPAGSSITAALADGNIMITGGGALDYDYPTNTPSVDGLSNMLCIFNKHGFLTVDDIALRNAPKYAFYSANAYSPLMNNIRLKTYSDGIHHHAPCWNVTLRKIRGRTGDDFIPFSCSDAGYTQYALPDSCQTVGEAILGFTAEDIWCESAVGSIAGYTADGAWCAGIVYRDVWVNQTGSHSIRFDTTPSATTGGIRDILIDDVTGNFGKVANIYGFALGGSGVMGIDSLKMTNIRAPLSSAGGTLMLMQGTTNVTSLEMDNISCVSGHYGNVLSMGSSCTITNGRVNGLDWEAYTTGSLQLFVLNGATRRFTVSRSRIKNTNSSAGTVALFYTANTNQAELFMDNVTFQQRSTGVINAASIPITFSNCVLDGGFAFHSSGIGCTLRILGGHVFSASQGVLNLYGSSVTYNVFIQGLNNAAGATVMPNYGTSSVYNWRNPSFDAAVDITKIARLAGATCLTSTAASTIVANNACVCDATATTGSWHQLSAPIANVY